MDYTPTTEEVREGYSGWSDSAEFVTSEQYKQYQAGGGGEGEFDRWLAEHDREVEARSWDEGFNSGYDSVLVDRSMKISTVDYRENPYREPNA